MKKKKVSKKKKRLINIVTVLYIIGILCIILWIILKISTPKIISTFIGRQQLYCSDEYYGFCYKVTFNKLVEYHTYFDDDEMYDSKDYFVIFERGKTIDKDDVNITKFTFTTLSTKSKYGRIHNYYRLYYHDIKEDLS